MKNEEQALLEEIVTKCNELMDCEKGLDSILSQIANNPEVSLKLRIMASSILTGDKF